MGDKTKLDWRILALYVLLAAFTLAGLFVVFDYRGPEGDSWTGKVVKYSYGAQKDRPELGPQKIEVLTAIGAVLGGLLIGLNALANQGRSSAMLKVNELTEDSHAQERFKTAIEQLGHPSDSVQFGAVYTLFHLAKERPEYGRNVWDILNAHIRDVTQRAGYIATHGPGCESPRPSNLVRSMINLLFRDEDTCSIYDGYKADLNHACLCRVDFMEARLREADLGDACLDNSRFDEAQLERAILFNASLLDVQAEGIHLEGSQLHHAQFTGAQLSGAHFEGAHIDRSSFCGTILTDAHFEGVTGFGAHFDGAILTGAYFQGVALEEARFGGASLNEAHLECAFLSGCSFKGAALKDVYFEASSFLEGSSRFCRECDFEECSSDASFLGDAIERVNGRRGQSADLSGIISSGHLLPLGSEGDLELIERQRADATKKAEEQIEHVKGISGEWMDAEEADRVLSTLEKSKDAPRKYERPKRKLFHIGPLSNDAADRIVERLERIREPYWSRWVGLDEL